MREWEETHSSHSQTDIMWYLAGSAGRMQVLVSVLVAMVKLSLSLVSRVRRSLTSSLAYPQFLLCVYWQPVVCPRACVKDGLVSIVAMRSAGLYRASDSATLTSLTTAVGKCLEFGLLVCIVRRKRFWLFRGRRSDGRRGIEYRLDRSLSWLAWFGCRLGGS